MHSPADDRPDDTRPLPRVSVPAPRRGQRAPATPAVPAGFGGSTGPAEPTEPQEAPEPAGPGYRIPEPRETGWAMDASPRRDRISRLILLGILAVQAVLCARLADANTASQDEALALTSGHDRLARLTHGARLPLDPTELLSGSPFLHPLLAALVDERAGLLGVRVLGLLCMVGTTALLYSLTRRMFNERVALIGAALFAVLPSTVVLGFSATYDAPALLLLTAAAWIVGRTDRAPLPAVLLAAPVAALAVCTAYASVFFLPALAGLVLLTAWPHHGRAAFLRTLVFGVGVAALLGAAAWMLPGFPGGVAAGRVPGTGATTELLRSSALWGALMLVSACAGAVSYTWRGRMNESPLSLRMSGPGRRRRSLVGVLLCGTAVLAPAFQLRPDTPAALYAHLGFGMLFAAPMAGIGLTRLVGKHFRYPQLGIMLWVTLLCLGIAQSEQRFASWPDARLLTPVLKEHITPGAEGRYLASAPHVAVYYLRDRTDGSRWTALSDRPAAAVRAGIDSGAYDLVVLDDVTSPGASRAAEAALAGSGKYHLVGQIPFHIGDGLGKYRIWAKR
ncbi:glycosyltransferase family 39 protein [Streptomyces sp. NPDC051567]|uniref:glycosyltransferase family 39 protein n=1 Tax=Streptomyces sp. NPDC051567 TaxID=3365660 RepID=UPI0037A1A294